MAAEFQPEEILAVLDRHDVTYVLIGGYAALLHGSTLPTTDIDITPRRDRDNLAKLVAALGELDARIRVSDDVEPLQFQTSPEPEASAQQLKQCVVLSQCEHPPGLLDPLVHVSRPGPRVAERGEGSHFRLGVARPPCHVGRLVGETGALVR